MAKPERSKFRIYAEYIPFYLLYQFIHLLPLKVAMNLAKGLFGLLYCFGISYRKRAVSHILHAGVRTNEKDARILARHAFIEFAKLLVEIVKMDQLYHRSRIRITGNPETIRKVFAPEGSRAPQNVILVTGHYGNWEVAGTAVAEQAGRPMVSIMRPFSNPKIGEMILNHRRSNVHELVNKGPHGLRQLIKGLHDDKIISILIDQHASESEGVGTIFFSQPCRTHKTPALLHLKTGIPILPEMTRRISDNFEFELEVGELICHTPTGDKERDIQEIMQRCTAEMERMIAKCPEQWLWSHRRWLNINRRH